MRTFAPPSAYICLAQDIHVGYRGFVRESVMRRLCDSRSALVSKPDLKDRLYAFGEERRGQLGNGPRNGYGTHFLTASKGKLPIQNVFEARPGLARSVSVG